MATEDLKKGVLQSAKNAGKGALKTATSAIGINFGLGIGVRKLTGQNWGQAILGEIGEAAFMAAAPGAYWTWVAASTLAPLPGAIYQGGKQIAENYNEARKRLARPTFSYQDTQQAVTMRQAAVQAIQGSKLNARNALGGEASLMHRSYKDRIR